MYIHDFDFEYLIQYISDNFVGLLLFGLVFVIIYTVDYISQVNAMFFAVQSPIPGLPPTLPTGKPKKSRNHK